MDDHEQIFSVIPARSIDTPGGAVNIFLEEDQLFGGAAEIYTSDVEPGVTKGWKAHRFMLMRLVVLTGTVEFCFIARSTKHKVIINANEATLIVSPGVTFAFRCVGDQVAKILNVPNMKTADDTVDRWPLTAFEF